LGCAESTAERLDAEVGDAQRKLREFDAEHYVEDRGPLPLGSLQSLPAPGRLELGSDSATPRELELYPAEGHTADGAAYWLPWARVLICGDYVSPVEIPMLSPGGSVAAYRATLTRLRPLIDQAEWVIPGHGAPLVASRAQEIVADDDSYLEQLERSPHAAGLPAGRSTQIQRRIHDANVGLLTGG
jgi:glyoxylase-like metal-dependent hydrolase (beta-lactamase superfamily II)